MITPKEAWLIFKKKFPDTPADSISDFGNYYLCSNGAAGDMIDDDWIIDKKTGELRELDFIEYMDLVRQLPEDEPDITYNVKDLES